MVIWYSAKYHLIYFILPGQRFLAYIQRHTDELSGTASHADGQMQPLRKVSGLTDRIISLLLPGTSCLIRSLVKRDVLKSFGYSTYVFFGLKKNDDQYEAHAWLSHERNAGFAKVYQIS